MKKHKDIIKNEATGQNAVKDALQDTLREIEIMKLMEHVNTIRLHEVIDDVQGDKLYLSNKLFCINIHKILVIDFAEHGELMHWNDQTCKFKPN